MSDQGYRPHERLRSKQEYERVLLRKCTARGKFLLVYVCENDCMHPRLGRIIGKRWGNAVARNRYRRWLREAFRQSKGILPAMDIVIMLTQKNGLTYQAVQAEFPELVREACHKLQRKY